MDRLAGKVIIVAGAGCIGDELARRYAGEGACVVAADIQPAVAEAVVAEIAASGGRAIATAFDGGDDASIADVVTVATRAYGVIDGFHANYAGFAPSDHGDLLALDMDDYDEIMRIDARGYVLCARRAIPAMLSRGGGSLVFTSSDAVYVAEPVRLSYAMAKASLNALMRNVARRFGPEGIRANVIAPGLVWHPKLEGLLPPEVATDFLQPSRAIRTTCIQNLFHRARSGSHDVLETGIGLSWSAAFEFELTPPLGTSFSRSRPVVITSGWSTPGLPGPVGDAGRAVRRQAEARR